MSSLDAGAWIWRPPSPYEYVLCKEILEFAIKGMPADERKLVRLLLNEYDGSPDDAELRLENLSAVSVAELLGRVRKTVRIWLEGETDAHWTDFARRTNGERGFPGAGQGQQDRPPQMTSSLATGGRSRARRKKRKKK